MIGRVILITATQKFTKTAIAVRILMKTTLKVIIANIISAKNNDDEGDDNEKNRSKNKNDDNMRRKATKIRTLQATQSMPKSGANSGQA